MENIPDPKYKIGDVVVVFNTQQKIKFANFNENKWKYVSEDIRVSFDEDQIIKKLN